MKLWTAQSVSLLGSYVSGFAVPTIAVTMLGATANQMALMSIVGALAFPLLGMIAATLVERGPKQGIMVAMDLGRMCAIGAIPVLSLLHRLDITVVIVVSCVLAVMGVFHDIAYQSHLPAVVPNDRIGEGNTKLELSNTASQSIGPALGGLLMHVLSAPLAMFLDAASYLISAISLGAIEQKTVREAPRREKMPFFDELWQGLRFIYDTPRLGRIALCTATMNFGSAISGVVSLIFLYRVLHLNALTVGLVFALSNLGFVGALYAIKFSERYGLLGTLSSAVLVNAFGRLLLPLASFFFPIASVFLSLMLTSLSGPIYNVAQISYRQRVTPLPIQARMHAAMRTVNSTTAPLGAMAGGILAGTIGIQHTLVFAAFTTALAAIWFVPIAQRDIPVLAEAA